MFIRNYTINIGEKTIWTGLLRHHFFLVFYLSNFYGALAPCSPACPGLAPSYPLRLSKASRKFYMFYLFSYFVILFTIICILSFMYSLLASKRAFMTIMLLTNVVLPKFYMLEWFSNSINYFTFIVWVKLSNPGLPFSSSDYGILEFVFSIVVK